MAILPLGISQVSNLLQSSITTNQIDSEQGQLVTIENELATGNAINTPSDNPAASAIIMQLQQTLNRQSSYTDTINSASASFRRPIRAWAISPRSCSRRSRSPRPTSARTFPNRSGKAMPPWSNRSTARR